MDNIVTQPYSGAFGLNNSVLGPMSSGYSFAFGDLNTINSYGSAAFGYENYVTSANSFAFGFQDSISILPYSVAFGYGNKSYGEFSVVSGRSSTIGNNISYSNVFGQNLYSNQSPLCQNMVWSV